MASSPSSSLRVAVQQALPHYTASSLPQQQQQQSLQSLTIPVHSTLLSHPHRRDGIADVGVNGASSLSSPPTPSPLSTSGSDAASAADAGAHSTTAAAAIVSGARDRRAPRKPNVVTSASIQAASAAAAPAVVGGVPAESAWKSNVVPSTSKAVVSNTNEAGGALLVPPVVLSPHQSPPPAQSQQLSTALTQEDEDIAASAKELQRQQILAHANDLLTFCAISNKVTSIRQCTSSFFVLLYQRLFDCTIAGIDRSPNTAEKRRHNVSLVLEQLRQHPYSLADIEAEEVVRLNEDHISRLIMVFVQVAEVMRRQQNQQQNQQQPPTLAEHVPYKVDATPGMQVFFPALDGAHGGGECGINPNSSGAYVPMGYTVAEVIPRDSNINSNVTSQLQQQTQQQQLLAMGNRNTTYPYTTAANAAITGNHHYRHGINDFYVAPAPPLNGGALDPSAAAATTALFEQQQPQQHNVHPSLNAGGTVAMSPYEGEESPSSVSYYLDSSVIPTDELLAEWYRNLVYPAPYTPKSEGSALLRSTATPLSEANYYRGMDSDDRYGVECNGRTPTGQLARPGRAAFSTTSSAAAAAPKRTSPLHTSKAGAVDEATPSRKPAAAAAVAAAGRGGAGRSRKPFNPAQRTQLNAHDIVHRCQRLEEALDAQEGRHLQVFVGQSSPPHNATTATAEERNSSRLHRGLPVQSGVEARKETVRADHQAHGLHSSPVKEDQRGDEGTSQVLPTSTLRPVSQEPPPPSQLSHDLEQDQLLQSQQQLPTQPQLLQQKVQQPAQHHRLVTEPPLTLQERDFLLHRPRQFRDAAQRDRKIERLRAARYLGDLQQLLRRRMRHEYDAQMSAMRSSLKASLATAKAEKTDLMRRVRDENERYRAAYATLMEAAANEAQVPARVMSRHTAQLADYYATSLQHSQAICDALKRETDRRTRAELLRYAEEVSAWQQHFLL